MLRISPSQRQHHIKWDHNSHVLEMSLLTGAQDSSEDHHALILKSCSSASQAQAAIWWISSLKDLQYLCTRVLSALTTFTCPDQHHLGPSLMPSAHGAWFQHMREPSVPAPETLQECSSLQSCLCPAMDLLDPDPNLQADIPAWTRCSPTSTEISGNHWVSSLSFILAISVISVMQAIQGINDWCLLWWYDKLLQDLPGWDLWREF